MDGAAFQPELALGSPGPGPPALVGRALPAGPAHAMKVVAGALPQGFLSTEPIARLISDRAPRGWPGDGRLWVAATEYSTGERVSFGRAGSPDAALPAAVAASCAVPGFYRPVRIGARWYVDGGVHTGANLDLVVGTGLDLVLCLNPLSSRPSAAPGIHWPVRTLLHQQLLPQARAVERTGKRLVLLEPDRPSIGLIGLKPMSRRRVEEIGRAAAIEVREYLGRPAVSDLLAGLC